jgi:capsular polysaccharide transport system permease protein
MVEPLLFAGLVGIVWRLSRGPEEHGVSIIAFVVSGYIPITLFRHGVSRSIMAFTANGSLLYHRQVKVLDFILARFFIEVLGGMMAYAFAAIVLVSFGEFPVPANIGTLIGGWVLYSVFCLSLCLVIAPLSEISEVIEKLVPVVTYIMIPVSGLPYMVSWMTEDVRNVLLWSPFVNGMEMMREGIWGSKVNAYYNIWNPIVYSMILCLIGLALCRHVRRTLAVE